MRMPGAGAALTAGMCLVNARALPVYLGYIDCKKPCVSLSYIVVCNSTNSFVTKKWCTPGIHHREQPYVIADGYFLQMGQCLVYVWYMAYTTHTPDKNFK